MEKFLNMLKSLYNIDHDRLPELNAAEWQKFRDDPPVYFIRADDVQAAAIFREIMSRQRI